MLSLRTCLLASNEPHRLFKAGDYIEAVGGAETQHAREQTEKFAKELDALKQTIKYPERTSMQMDSYPVTAKDSGGILTVLKEKMPHAFATGALLKAAYVNMSREARLKQPAENINLIISGDSLSVKDGVLTVLREGGHSFEVNIFPWDGPVIPVAPAAAPASEVPAAEVPVAPPEVSVTPPVAPAPAPELPVEEEDNTPPIQFMPAPPRPAGDGR
ncbi:hypothetical protein IPG41_04860 [Candidatus Peregrinibacteria bacterium]|nr:MAG: hypothetical protein IPG41_04860 [Candidatus Peregrinibacteria bacterium]